MNSEIEDFNIEGAVKLMDKTGQNFEDRSKMKKSKSDGKGAESYDQFLAIINRFTDLMEGRVQNSEGKDALSNRVKLLIKNMFANRESGWSKTKDLNSAGPKTKAEVHNDVQNKYE